MSFADSLSARWRQPLRATPQAFYRLAGPLARALWAMAAVTGAAGLVMALCWAQSDRLPGEAWRIFFVHVPAAWLSMLLFLALALASALGCASRSWLAPVLALALAPTGTMVTALAIWTGALWGRATLGDWWVWDARLVAELGLLVAYVGTLVLPLIVDDLQRLQRVGAALAFAGVVSVVLVYRSAHRWQVLIPDGTAAASHAPSMTNANLAAVILASLALGAWCVASTLHRARSIVLERERLAAWTRALPEVQT